MEFKLMLYGQWFKQPIEINQELTKKDDIISTSFATGSRKMFKTSNLSTKDSSNAAQNTKSYATVREEIFH